jgi:hypothetical protein
MGRPVTVCNGIILNEWDVFQEDKRSINKIAGMAFIIITLENKMSSFILQTYQIIGFSWLQKYVTKQGITVLPQLSYSSADCFYEWKPFLRDGVFSHQKKLRCCKDDIYGGQRKWLGMSSCSSSKATGANIWQWKGTALKAVCNKVDHDQPSLHGQKFIKFLSLTHMNCTQVLFPGTWTELVFTFLHVADSYCYHHQRDAIL